MALHFGIGAPAANVGIIVGIFGFDEIKLSEHSFFDYTFSGNKAGGNTADLTDHQATIILLGRLDHTAAGVVIKGERLFAEDVLPCRERLADHLLVKISAKL